MGNNDVEEHHGRFIGELIRDYLEELKPFERKTHQTLAELDEHHSHYHMEVKEKIYRLHNTLAQAVECLGNYTKGKEPITVYLNQAELGRLKVIRGEESEYECLRRLMKEVLKEQGSS